MTMQPWKQYVTYEGSRRSRSTTGCRFAVFLYVLSFTWSAGFTPAFAQIGLTRNDASRSCKFERRVSDTIVYYDPSTGTDPPLQSWRVDWNAGALGQVTFQFFLIDDRVECATDEFMREQAGMGISHNWDLAFGCLSRLNWHVLNGEPKRVTWAIEPGFDTVFPPIGVWKNHVTERRRYTGKQSKTITVNRRTGQIVGESPWEAISLPTGRFDVNTWTSTTRTQVLVSDDRQIYALVTLSRGSYGSYQGSVKVDSLYVCSGEFLWRCFFLGELGCVKSLVGGGFDGTLSPYVPAPVLERTRLYRLVNAALVLTDVSTLPVNQLVEGLKRQEKWEAGLRDVLVDRAQKGLHAAPSYGKLRRANLLAMVQGPPALATIVTLMRDGKELEREAIRLMRETATSHHLPKPPEDDSSYAQWKKWVEMVTPNGE